MDRLGLPVFAAVRPRGKSLRVHAGKGLNAVDARVGAWMEAIELATADPERTGPALHRPTAARLEDGFGGRFGLVDLCPVLGAEIGRDQRITSVRCQQLTRRARALVPAELVFVPWRAANEPSLYPWSSNGLASGNTIDEATVHALFEVLERDAIAMNLARDDTVAVDEGSFPLPFQVLRKEWSAIGIALSVRSLPNAFGIPCFVAVLHDPESRANLAEGAGLHADREIAIGRAICEAAQSRLSVIHGGRDDVVKFFSKYEAHRLPDTATVEARLIAQWFDRSRVVALDAIPSLEIDRRSMKSLLGDLIDHLSGCGFGDVLRYRFRIDLGGLKVVKVIVPRCEYSGSRIPRIGPRLLARITGHA